MRDVALKWQIERRADQRSGGRVHPGVHAPLSNPNRYQVYKGRSWPPWAGTIKPNAYGALEAQVPAAHGSRALLFDHGRRQRDPA